MHVNAKKDGFLRRTTAPLADQRTSERTRAESRRFSSVGGHKESWIFEGKGEGVSISKTKNQHGKAGENFHETINPFDR